MSGGRLPKEGKKPSDMLIQWQYSDTGEVFVTMWFYREIVCLGVRFINNQLIKTTEYGETDVVHLYTLTIFKDRGRRAAVNNILNAWANALVTAANWNTFHTGDVTGRTAASAAISVDSV